MEISSLNSATLDVLDAAVMRPQYDREQASVGIVHFGVGGFHRAHQAVVIDDLLAAGHSSWGICGVGLLPGDARMRDVMNDQDTLYSLITRTSDGTQTVRVIGSILEYLFAPDDQNLVLQRLTDPATRIVSLTVTEGGYLQDHATGLFDPQAAAVRSDLSDPEHPTGTFGYIVEALRLRRESGIAPFTVMSCDNIRSNGDIARQATVEFAQLRSLDLAEWISENVTFPNSMVDRITPVTSPEDREFLGDNYGVRDAWPVASEDFFQWVLEDRFCDGRPPYQDAAVEVVDDVVPFELMKLRLLNASHQVIAFLGLLVGYRLVHDAARDELFASVLRHFWREEAIPTLAPIPGVDYIAYSESLLERYSNAHIRDTLDRLATDASNRIPTFVLPVARDCGEADRPASVSALTVAAWEKVVLGVDENGDMLVQNDQRAAELLTRARLGGGAPDGFLGDAAVFGALGAEPSFVAQFENQRDALRKGSARSAIERIVGKGPA